MITQKESCHAETFETYLKPKAHEKASDTFISSLEDGLNENV